MVVRAKVCELTDGFLWFVCGLYVKTLTSPLIITGSLFVFTDVLFAEVSVIRSLQYLVACPDPAIVRAAAQAISNMAHYLPLRIKLCLQKTLHVLMGELQILFIFFFFYLNSISYNISAVFSVSRSSSGCQSEQYRLVVIQY